MDLIRVYIKPSKRLKKDRDEVLANLKSVPCADCRLTFPPECMDFDHIPTLGRKRKNVSAMRRIDQIISEAKKCDVVCSNCHRIRTRDRRRDAKRQRESRAERLNAIEEMVERAREAARGIAEEAPISFNDWYES